MSPRRLRAPAQDGGVLIEPALAQAEPLARSNHRLLAAWDHDFQGRRADWLRARAQAEVAAAAARFQAAFGLEGGTLDGHGPLILTGHQPELFHPGVWIKNFATAGLARRIGGRSLNLIVDDDTPKRAGIRVPTRGGNGSGLHTVWVDFDAAIPEAPYEDWAVGSEATFDSFAERVRAALGPLIADPILDDFWPLVRQRVPLTDRVGLRFATARAALERQWGVANAEVPLSRICETEAFAWFVSHVLAHLPRFQQVHNDALLRYRKLYRIRSRNHPVPALAVQGEWLEAPFWVWHAAHPRRRPLLARAVGDDLELRIAGEAEPFARLPLSADRDACCAVDQLLELPGRRIRLRTRALTTTLFSRLLLGDLFVHGIGGAKYDELGDEVCRGFFGLEPPPYLTVSMTLRAGLPADPATSADLYRVERELRDLDFNPERYLAPPLDAVQQDLIRQKQAVIAGPQDTRAQRVHRFHAFLELNAALARPLASRHDQLAARRTELAQTLRHNAVAASREYSCILHSQRRWLEAARPFGPAPSAIAPLR